VNEGNALAGRTVLLTRTRSQAPEFRRLLEAAGAHVLEIPAIEIQPRFGPELDAAIAGLESYDWLFFTSANSAEIVLPQVSKLRPDIVPCELRKPRICAIGPATASRIQDFRYVVSLVPDVFQAEGVIEEFHRINRGRLEGLRILLPRASEAREILPEELRRRGAVVDVIPVYDTVLPEGTAEAVREVLKGGRVDLVTFTSSSTVRNFVQAAGPDADLTKLTYAAIGPITAATAAEYGLPVAILPADWTVPALARAILDFFAAR
jgi:uroporphyrinogen III methyltransferase / synthase